MPQYIRRYVKKQKRSVVVDFVNDAAWIERTLHPVGGLTMASDDDENFAVGWCNIAGNDHFAYDKAQFIMEQRLASKRHTFNRNSPDSIAAFFNMIPRQLHETAHNMIVAINDRIDRPRSRCKNAVV